MIFKRSAATRLIFFIAIDVASIILSVWLSFLIRFDGVIPQQYEVFLPRIIMLLIIFIVPIFYFQKLYSFSWSYVSANEAISLFLATTVSFIFLGITIYVSKYFPAFLNFPRATIAISYILVFVFCSLSRFAKRIYIRITASKKTLHKDKTLIVGAGDSGEQMLRNILSAAIKPYFISGFIDDSKIKQGVAIHGVKVLGKISDIPNIVSRSEIKQLIIALPSHASQAISKAIELGRNAGIKKIKIAPQLTEIIRGEFSVKNLQDIRPETLLGRESMHLNKNQIENFIKNRTVLVTGSAGSIGSELSLQVAAFQPSLLILLDQDETGIFNISGQIRNKFPKLKIHPLVADIKEGAVISSIFKELKPNIVFHAAAYKHVPLMEAQPDEAVRNNIFGTENLIKESAANQVEKFVFISTDKAVNPSSVMGATKRIGEMLCQAHNQKNQTKFISVRFGNVLDSRGSVIPIFREQIRKRGPVEVTDPEMKRYFMLNSEACLLVMQAGAMGQGGEVFVLDMGEPIKILDLAKEMIRLSGFKPDKDIAIVFTGIRPGEKLFEEILTAEEGILATQNEKIFMAKMSGVSFDKLKEDIAYLKDLISRDNFKEIIDFLKSVTPYYK